MGILSSLLSSCRIDAREYKRRTKNKTAEQKRVLNYFVKSGLIPMFTNMKDEEYDALVQSKRNAIDIKKKALGKIGLDESQVNEIPPVCFEGYEFTDSEHGGLEHWTKIGKDGVARSSAYSVTQLFFSDTQVYMYQIIFSMDDGAQKERTEEYFYRDITNFSTTSETEQIAELSGCTGKVTDRMVNVRRFSMIVPGDRFTCSTSQDIERQVSAMKAKLREKKQV